MSSVPRRRRYYEGATTSHPASRPLLVRDRVPRGPPGFVLAEALPGGWRSRPSLGRLVRRRPGSGWRPRGRGGISYGFRLIDSAVFWGGRRIDSADPRLTGGV